MSDLNNPLILIGTGRSGSTALHRLLAFHPELSWLSGLCNRFPTRPLLNKRFMQILDLPVVGRLFRRRWHPGEAYIFWEACARGFGRPFRDLYASDVTAREKRNIRNAMAACISPSRPRLLLKITGWPRVGFLSECFPNAKFVHLVRDGRAVANSMLAVPFWDGWGGPSRWRWGELSEAHKACWEASGQSFVALAGIEWVMMQETTDKACQTLDASRFLRIRYEDFCADKIGTTRKIVDFADLEWTLDFEKNVGRFAVSSANKKWQADLTPKQQEMLTQIQHGYLERYGYIGSAA